MMQPREHTSFHADHRSWPERLQQLADQWHGPLEETSRERTREEIWLIVVGALDQKIRRQLSPRSAADPDLAHDLAVKKALDLLARFARGEWDPRSSAPGQLQSFFALLARNSVVDYQRSRTGRTRAREVESEPVRASVPHVAPDEFVGDRRKLATAVIACARMLTDRARKAWFLRLFYDMSSRRIGAHPEVAMTPEAVDMALHRSRDKMQSCLRKRGFDKADFGAGVYAACWEAFNDSDTATRWRQGTEGEK